MRVALIGNQNSGKTSLFNKLTGSNQKVGNWPGVTVQKKEGIIQGTDIEIIDLPGVYSLLPYTAEENISRGYLLAEKPDLVLNVIDSTSLERSLYLTTQLMDLGVRVVLALNMIDLLTKKNIKLDEEILSKELGLVAIKTSAKTGEGITELIKILKNHKTQNNAKIVEKYPKIIENELKIVKNTLKIDDNFKAIENVLGVETNEKCGEVARTKSLLSKVYGENLEEVFANERYNFISKIRNKCLKISEKKETVSDKLDKIFLNKYFAIFIFVATISLMYFLSVGVVGKYTSGVISDGFQGVSNWLRIKLKRLGASDWSVSLLADGVVAGVGSVLSFLPQLIVIFFCISLLETTGYMSRISFIFDKIFRWFGLSGKSLVPFIVGTGCSVPAISSTKTIEKKQEKDMTIVLTPFIPCGAKLPIIAFFAGAFFPDSSGLVTASLYFFAIVLIMLSALLLKKVFYKNQRTSFISELPEYKAPNLKYIARDVTEKTKDFVVRAGTIILFCSCLVWFLTSFSWNLCFSSNIEDSIMAGIGKCFSWFFYPIIGEMNWAVSVSAIQGLIAKEQVVSSLTVISGVGGAGGDVFASGILSCFNKASSYAFMVFNLFSAPCIAAIGAMKTELGSTKKTFFAIFFQIMIAWIVASLTFFVGTKLI